MIVNQGAFYLLAFATVGTLLATSLFVVNEEGALTSAGIRLKKIAGVLASLWLLSSFLGVILKVAQILGTNFAGAFDGITINSYLTQTALGKSMLVQLIGLAIVSVAIPLLKRVLPLVVLTGIALIALIAPIFQSHAAANGSHALAIGALTVHVIALTLWVGGLFGIIAIPREDRTTALYRFSQLALWAAIAVVASGLATAWTRLNEKSAWGTQYSYVVIAKVLLTVALLAMGYANRKSLESRDELRLQELTRLVGVEAMVMVAVVLMGSWLSQIQPPVGDTSNLSAAQLLVGQETPPPPSFMNLLKLYNPDALMIALLITAVALYIKGVAVLKSRGDSWPVGRTVAFASAIVLIDFATSGGLGVYAVFSFEYHMVAHMLLGMIAPIGLVLGAPITLALRTLPQGRTSSERGVRALALKALHSRYSIILTNPITALALFDGSLFVLYFTDLFGNLMQNHAGHIFMNIHFILVGFLFFNVVIGVDPTPKKVPHIIRIVILFGAMSLHAFFSIALMSESTLIDGGYYGALQTPWLPDLLADQRAGGTIGWAMGEIPILLALVATFILWMREDKRETVRIDRNEARLAAMGEPDELAQYNAYLNTLQQRDVRRGQQDQEKQ
jgi:cytochrome c oxidase assembly factor CtaG/putative copper export protein